MCGIHLIIDKQTRLRDEQPLRHMMRASAYRGPDAKGTQRIEQTSHTVWLGSHRLQISDPHPRADQPFSSPDDRYTLLYNGEIYNHYELRNRLLSEGTQFATHSDTEVLLHWLMSRGTAGLSELNGMFAFVLYDRQDATLWAARDRWGMKPLYYADTHPYLLISSEANSIVASGLVDTEFEQQAVDSYLRFRYPSPGITFHKNIRCIGAGQSMKFCAGTAEALSSYAEAETVSTPELPEKALLKNVEHQLTEAVLRHWTADVPAGLFLSGGVDSTLLLALLRQEGISVPTFSLGHTDADRRYGTRDDRFARQAAQQYDAYHQEITVTATDLEEHFDRFIQRTDQPVGDSGAFMTYLLSHTAQQSVKVVLSGAGADELFGGYHRHAAYHRYLRWYAGLVRALPFARGITRWLPTGGNYPGRAAVRLLHKLSTDLTDDPIDTWMNFISLSGFRSLGNKSTLLSDPLPLPTVHDHGAVDFVEQHLHYALQHDQQHYLISDVLAISDSASMAHGLEMRLPYLDAELVQTVNRLSATWRLQHGRKWILRRILEGKGGKAYARRRKEGFGLPFGRWLRDPALPVVRRYLEPAEQMIYRYVSRELVHQMLRQHRRGRRDYSQELWAVLVLAAWLDHRFSNR